jgi:beta-aspartyl-dipeptidase (metallo-type)
MATLIGKAKGLERQGLSAFVYTGGYGVPPATLLGSVRRDMIFVSEVIGAGEIAIADTRGSQPSVKELSRIAADAYVGGLLTGKAGVVHFHVGDSTQRLSSVRRLLASDQITPECLYPTHVERNGSLLAEAAAITHRGVFVDIDTVGNDLARSLRAFAAAGGDFNRLTVSSDASITPPRQRLDQVRECAQSGEWPLEQLLPLVTANPAAVLRLTTKGHLNPGADADVLVLQRDSLMPRHVLAGGRVLMREGELTAHERFLRQSSRKVPLHGNQA